jgi:pilus assembly protein CpaE
MKIDPISQSGEAPVSGPWRRSDERRGDGQRLRVALMLHAESPAPDLDSLTATGLDVAVAGVDLAAIAEDSPLFEAVDAIVVEIRPQVSADMEAFDRLVHLAAGHVAVIAAVEGLTVADTRTLLRAGAVDVLPLPFAVEELQQAVEPARRPARPAATRTPTAPARQGKVVSFMGALGGVGATSIATQAGILWAAHARVCLIDFDIQFGNAALSLDLRPSLTLAHLIEDEARLDVELLQSVAIRHASGLNVIACPVDIVPLDLVTPEFVNRILRLAVQAYDVVLVDLPTAWTEWSLRALERSDLTCLVTNLSVSGIYQARRQLEIVEANHLMEKTRIIANRVQHKMFGRVDLRETESVLGRRIDFTIANDYPSINAANDQGLPVSEISKGSRLVKDLKALSAALSAAMAGEGAPRP